jgi:hypothetical protein
VNGPSFVGVADWPSVGESAGESVGESPGEAVDESVGVPAGVSVGDRVCPRVGESVDLLVVAVRVGEDSLSVSRRHPLSESAAPSVATTRRRSM